jgi:glycopeptide antibiotics resistance protein
VSDHILPTDTAIVLGLLVVIPLVLWAVRRSHLNRWSGWLRVALAIYVVVLTALLFTPLPIPPWTPIPEGVLDGYRPWPFPWLNIVPFETISVALRYGLDWRPGRVLVGNVLAFAPFGVLLPLIWARWRSLIAVVGAGLAISIAAESAQLGLSVLMGFPYRVADVDDVIINVLGVALGYGLYRLIGLVVPRAPAVQPAN